MTKPSCKITVPEVIADFKSYHQKYQAWGSLHIVLEDQNVEDHAVQFCIEDAQRNNDREGEQLGCILLTLSKSQRIKIGSTA